MTYHRSHPVYVVMPLKAKVLSIPTLSLFSFSLFTDITAYTYPGVLIQTDEVSQSSWAIVTLAPKEGTVLYSGNSFRQAKCHQGGTAKFFEAMHQ